MCFATMVTIKNSCGEKLSGIFTTNAKTKKLIMICHGSRGSKNGTMQKSLLKSLKDKYNIFRFDFSGNGDSEGRLEDSTYTKDCQDILAVVDYFLSKKYIIKAIIGHSKSGTEVLLISEKLAKRSVENIIAIAPRIFLKNTSEMAELRKNKDAFDKNGYYVFPNSKDNHKITKKYIADLKKWWDVRRHYKFSLPTHIIQGTHDSVVNISESEEFIKRFRDVRLHKIDNATHVFKNKIGVLQNKINSLL